MLKLTYDAKWDAIQTDSLGCICITAPDDIELDANNVYEIELDINLQLPQGVSAIVKMYPFAYNNIIMCSGEMPFISKTLKVRLYNPLSREIKYMKGSPMFKVDFYRQSITLAGVSYNKETTKCMVDIDNLESSIVQIPNSQICFENIHKD